jgi:hypothetical protein
VKDFLRHHTEKIAGVLSCFDRLVFKGYLPLVRGDVFETFLDAHGILYKHFKPFVLKQAQTLKVYAQALATQVGRPFIYLNAFTRKEDLVRKLLNESPVACGLVCILAAVEGCQSFVLRYGDDKPRLQSTPRKCLCLYYYFLDPELGLLHVRIQTWFPFTIQICLNGHDWLARKLDHHHIAYRKLDNAFLSIDDFPRAQRFADQMAKKKWPRVLSAFARKANPLLKGLLRNMDYCWVTDQAEFSTDIVFKDKTSLQALYPHLLRHATFCLSAEDVLTFLGRKLSGNFQGEVLTDLKKRLPGTRVKHRMKQNWIKMYDKFGVLLRIETVINHPYEFRVRRRGKRHGQVTLGWFPLPKAVAYLPRFAHVAFAANQRYLQALAALQDPSETYRRLDRVCEPVPFGNRRRRGLNPLRRNDVALFAAVLRGEHAIHGFRNRDLAVHLDPSGRTDPQQTRKSCARMSRLLQLLRAHGLIAKIPRSRRYRLTAAGASLMPAALYLRRHDFPDLLNKFQPPSQQKIPA